jgi:hypothetical protein
MLCRLTDAISLNKQSAMRAILMLVLSGALLVGCKHPKPSDAAAAPSQTPATKRTDKKSGETKGTAAQASPIMEAAGKVASVNPELRFVVIDFALNPVPKVDQRMSVYRQGQKVGEVKISSQARNSIIAADITAGEAKIGDEVRPK